MYEVRYIDNSEFDDVESLPNMDNLSIIEQARLYPPKGWTQLFKDADSELERISSLLEDRGSYYPIAKYLFHAFRVCPLSLVKVIIIGQDPYPREWDAYGLSFSTPPGGKIPASLNNIYKELENEYKDFIRPDDGCLLPWADQGVLLLNYCLTYHPEMPFKNSEYNVWMPFIRLVIDAICKANPNAVFIMWGKKAEIVSSRIKGCKKLIGAHPSPLGGGRFIGCGHFIEANQHLTNTNQGAIDWHL